MENNQIKDNKNNCEIARRLEAVHTHTHTHTHTKYFK